MSTIHILRFVLLTCFVFVLLVNNFTHATISGYSLDVFIGSNYTNGLSANEANPKFSSVHHQLLFLDKRNGDLYYSIGNYVIRKLDKNGIVTTIAGSVRNIGNFDIITNIKDYYYALDRSLNVVSGLVVDPQTNEVYYLNQGLFLERIRNSDKKAVIAVGEGSLDVGLGYQVRLSVSTSNYVRGLAINSKNEIFILQNMSISRYNITNYSTSVVLGGLESGAYRQIVLSKDETFLYAVNGNTVEKITVLDGNVTYVTDITDLTYIDCVGDDLYLLTMNGVYLFRNNIQTLVAGTGVSGAYQNGMNATNLVISYGATMMVSNSRDIYLTDSSNSVALLINGTNQQVTELFPTNTVSNQTYSARNMSFYSSIVAAAYDSVSGNVYTCHRDGKMYRYDGNQVQEVWLSYTCSFVASNAIGEVYFISGNIIYQLVDGVAVPYAGNGIAGIPTIGSLANETGIMPTGLGFYSNNDMFIQSYIFIFRIDRVTHTISQEVHNGGNALQQTIIDSNDILYISDGSGIQQLFPNGTSLLIAGSFPIANRRMTNQERLLDGEEDGESAFGTYISTTGMAIGPDGKLYFSYGYRIRTVSNESLWTLHFVDSQQGPMDASYITGVVLLGRYGNNIMLTIPWSGNLYLLKPISGNTCFGKNATASSVCSGYGSCVGPNRCSCQSSNFGFECEYSYCNNTSGMSYQTVCGGIGSCSAPDVCTCPNGYSGLTCSSKVEISCYGTMSNSSLVCSGKGICVGMDQCSCNSGRLGSYCQFDFCVSSWDASTESLTCNSATSSNVEVNQSNLTAIQLNSKVLRFIKAPTVQISFPSDFSSYLVKNFPEITDQSQLNVISSIYSPTLDTSQDLMIVSPITSLTLYKNTSDVLNVNNLATPIVIEFNNVQIDKVSGGFNYSCMYYDTAAKSWSSSGIVSTITASTLSSNSYTFSLKCETFHLTSFSVIDMNYKKANRDDTTTVTLSGLTTGGIIALAVCLGAGCLICVVVSLIVAAICGVCCWTRQKKKKNMS